MQLSTLKKIAAALQPEGVVFAVEEQWDSERLLIIRLQLKLFEYVVIFHRDDVL